MIPRSCLAFLVTVVCTFDISVRASELATSAAHKTFPNQAVAEASYVIRSNATVSNDFVIRQRADDLVQRIYQHYKKLFPIFMANKEIPSVVIIKSDSAWESQAYMPDSIGDHMGMLALTEGLFGDSIDQETRIGIIAHEIAHVLFWHRDVETKALKAMTINGRVLTNEEASAVERWFFLAQLAGGFAFPEFNGLALTSGHLYHDLADLAHYLKLRGSGNCGEAALESMGKLISGVLPNFSYYRFDFEFRNSAVSQETNQKMRELIARMHYCFTNDPGLKERIVLNQKYQINGTPNPAKDVFLKVLSQKEIDETTTDIELITRAGAKAHAEMNALKSKYNLINLRWYSGEDQADEAAIVVLKSLGLDALKYRAGMASALTMSEPDRQRCDADLAARREPPYGDLSDPHHAPCWRAWRMQEFILKNESLSEVK